MKDTMIAPVVNRSFGLDLTRAFAITLVLIAHFVKQLEHFGFWGVELFFGLSGFLIGQILWRSFSETEDWSFKYLLNFWSRRWWRTVPNYYLFLVIMLIFHYSYDQLPSVSLFIKHLWFGQNFLARNGGFFGVAWSLCIEEWFYLIFPTVLFLISKLKARPKTAFILSLIIVFVFCAIVREVLIRQHVGHSLRGITMARLDAIGCGVLVAFWLSTTKITPIKRWAAFCAGTVLFIISFVTVYFSGQTYDEIKESRYLLVSVSLGFSLMLPVISLMPRPAGIFKYFSAAVEKVSHWTYSLYLSHIPVMFAVYSLMGKSRSDFYVNTGSKVIGLVITFVVSAVIFKYFELPFTHKRPREIRPGKL
ncbi:acyltransferase family protein [Pedobacter metabolipauper]|uniref:Peptidoglycan/LPS O-acetylase OafA/YrhL n=1 Tax=Pedobacter metabolipauper TaxID=425513 RepID=A0A4R6SZ31_9SPHI|nr:acyltransferase [Pedobacter metabolipauper]TDQ09992.1 peptidoglycan/LPS O-acetylase OafA/YrhL [Pedobacter metabolipauper]